MSSLVSRRWQSQSGTLLRNRTRHSLCLPRVQQSMQVACTMHACWRAHITHILVVLSVAVFFLAIGQLFSLHSLRARLLRSEPHDDACMLSLRLFLTEGTSIFQHGEQTICVCLEVVLVVLDSTNFRGGSRGAIPEKKHFCQTSRLRQKTEPKNKNEEYNK